MKIKHLCSSTIISFVLVALVLLLASTQSEALAANPENGIFSLNASTLSSLKKEILAPQATTWYVDADSGNDGFDCQSPGTACETIEAAIGKAIAGDTIEIAAGIYDEHDIEISKNLLLDGAGAESTIVDAGGNGRVFHVSAMVTISNLRMQNGVTNVGDFFTQSGGAILVGSSAHLTLESTTLIDNHAIGSGGAIFNVGNLWVNNTQILSNTTDIGGGGIYNYNIGILTVTNSLIANNSAAGSGTGGGGIYAGGQSLNVQNSTISGNIANYLGGGISIFLSNPTVLDGITLSGNQSVGGAGFFVFSGALTVTNATISGNTATNNYGGIYISGPSSSLFVQNSTILENDRTNTSGNGFNGIMTGNNAVATMVNTILAHNQENNCSSFSPPTSLGHNLSSDFTCGLTQSGDQPGVDPNLGPLNDNGGFVQTHALMPGSPAIDAADDAQCPATDARGIARPFDGDGDAVATCDIGAVEARHQLSIADSSILEGDSSAVTAVFTVTLAPTSTAIVEVDYATIAGSATSGVDYTSESAALTFNPGETEKYIQIDILGDFDDEADETFDVQLSNPVNADLLDDNAIGTIIDNDGLPTLSIADQEILEGNTGSISLQFEIVLSPASASMVTVEYDTADGAATAGEDYTPTSGMLNFQPGETSQMISIDILGDIVDEGVSEDFSVQLSNPSNANTTIDIASGTIIDDDEARLSQGLGPRVTEGDSGHTPAVFTITLSTPADFVISVDFETSSGYGDEGATMGEDFEPISGTLTFQPGETFQTYTVQIIGDTERESDERYNSLISNANVPITVNGSFGTILNDDGYQVFLPLIIR